MTLANMKKALDERGITQRQVAESMDMTENNFSLKINERIPMTVDEAKFIQRTYFEGNTLDYLLESDGDIPTVREKELANLDAVEDIVHEIGGDDIFGPAIDKLRAELSGDDR